MVLCPMPGTGFETGSVNALMLVTTMISINKDDFITLLIEATDSLWCESPTCQRLVPTTQHHNPEVRNALQN